MNREFKTCCLLCHFSMVSKSDPQVYTMHLHKCSYRIGGCCVRNTRLSEVTLGILLYSYPCVSGRGFATSSTSWIVQNYKHADHFKAAGAEPEFGSPCDMASPALESIPVGYDQHPIKSQWSRAGMCNEWLCGHLFLSQWTASPPSPLQNESMLQFKNNKEYYPLHALLSEPHVLNALWQAASEQNVFRRFCTPVADHDAGCGGV